MSFKINAFRDELIFRITALNKAKGRRELLQQQLSESETKEQETQTYLDNLLKARAVAQHVAEETQRKLEYHISNLVSTALASVFKNAYELQVRYVQRRGKTECDLIFIKNGNETDDLLNSAGGGPADVASFSLRLSVWSIKKTRAMITMDEPFKYLSIDLQEKCSEMLKELSTKLGIQIVMVSHLPNLIAAADNIIRVKNVDGISIIETEGEQ